MKADQIRGAFTLGVNRERGREIAQAAAPGFRPPTKLRLPVARDLTLPDGRVLSYRCTVRDLGQRLPVSLDVEGGVWSTDDGLSIIATIDPDRRVGRFLHVSLARQDRDPSWNEILMVRYTFYPKTTDVFMVLPKDGDHLNVHPHTFQMRDWPTGWELPR